MKDKAQDSNAKWSCPPAAENQPRQMLSRAASLVPPTKLTTTPKGDTHARRLCEAQPTTLITGHLQQLLDANEELQQEVLRCNDRLSVILELSESSGLDEDPDAREHVLLRRYASTLNADALLVDYGDERGVVAAMPSRRGAPPVDAETVAAVIADDIDTVRRSRRAAYINAAYSNGRGAAGMHVLLGALLTDAERPHVVIALRAGHRAPFDGHDSTSSETVLVYGGHLLRSLLMVRRLQQTSLEAVGSLANAVEARDAYTGGHSERVGWLAVLTGEALGLNRSDLQMLEWSGLLHDIGKIGISEQILNKPGKLTPEEFEEIKKHPRVGYEVLRPLSGLKPVLDAVLYHHENHDGSGYPDGLRGDESPLFARILRVVDTFDALTSTRSYRAGLPADEALDVLIAGSGETTDPDVTPAFVAALRKLIESNPDEFRRRFPHLHEALAELQQT